MGPWDITFLVFGIVAVLAAGLYFLNRWASTKMVEQQDMLKKTKQPVTIFIIDKKKEKPAASSLPKEVKSKLPPVYKFMKMPLVKAKVGPQVTTLMCDPKVFEALPVKKNVRVELAGIYIAEMKGMKTKKERRELAKAKSQPVKWYEKLDPRKIFSQKNDSQSS
jgi:hypothetical protein